MEGCVNINGVCIFKKWAIVLGIKGKLDHPVIACNCIACEYTKYPHLVMSLCFFMVMVMERIIFFFYLLY